MAGRFWKSWSNERIMRPLGRTIALLTGFEATGRRAQPALVVRIDRNIEGPRRPIATIAAAGGCGEFLRERS
jgi:hypothetical protein